MEAYVKFNSKLKPTSSLNWEHYWTDDSMKMKTREIGLEQQTLLERIDLELCKFQMASAIGKCKICGEQLNYQPDEITAFGRHLIEKHINDQITHFQFKENGISDNLCECGCACGCNCDEKARKKKTYKTTGTHCLDFMQRPLLINFFIFFSCPSVPHKEQILIGTFNFIIPTG